MNIPSGTVVKVIGKELNIYNKILVVEYVNVFNKVVCSNLKGCRSSYFFEYCELEILPKNCNLLNSICIFCGTYNKFYRIKNNRNFRYCPKCLR